MTTPTHTRRRRAVLLTAGALALAISSCASPGAGESTPSTAETTTANEIVEQSAASPRLALTYEGGIQILDANTLQMLDDIPLEGFTRLNPAGDQRHVMVASSGGFQVLDLATWAEPHGDHAHYYTSDPALLDITYEASTPGHVVVHSGRTALFDDGTGDVTVLNADAVADSVAARREYTTAAAHHGVAVELSDGTLLVTDGTSEARTGAIALNADGAELAQSQECPGIHGEAVTDDEAAVFGCEDGALLYRDGTFIKIDAPDEFGRIGNLRAAPGSDVVLGDYNADPDGGALTQIALIDVHKGSMAVVDLGVEYTFRSLERDGAGNALVLGTDGAIHVIDVEAGSEISSVPVLGAWDVPAEWQQPRPSITMLAGSAYITDPAGQQLFAVDIPSAQVWQTTRLSQVPNEIVGVTGDVADGALGTHSDDEGHEGHEGHDDDHDHGDHDH